MFAERRRHIHSDSLLRLHPMTASSHQLFLAKPTNSTWMRITKAAARANMRITILMNDNGTRRLVIPTAMVGVHPWIAT